MERLSAIPALHRATHRVGLYVQAHVPDVSQGEAHLLAHLHEHGAEATVAELHRAWAHKRSTLTDILDRLEARGLATRGMLPADRRSVLVRLTAKGRRSAAAVHRRLAELERAALSGADRGALAGFVQIAERLAAAATERSAQPTPPRRAGERKDAR